MTSEPTKVTVVAAEEEVEQFMNDLRRNTQRRQTVQSESESGLLILAFSVLILFIFHTLTCQKCQTRVWFTLLINKHSLFKLRR